MKRSRALAARRRKARDAWALVEQSELVGYRDDLMPTLRALAADDDIAALNVLALLHEEGRRAKNGAWMIERSPTLARRYNDRAAALGDPGAITSMADRIKKRPGTAALRRAEALYRRAFRMGYVTAAFNLANTYRNRRMFPAAVRWYRKALAGGDESALFELGCAELYGLGTKRDPVAGMSKLRRLARSQANYYPPNCHRMQAMVAIARAFVEGWVVEHDYDVAMAWLRRAAALGSGVAKAELAGW
jgi:TPR repeat protein